MTPEERDRLTRLETEHKGLKAWMESIDSKVDQLIAVSNMGKGAWFFLLKVGGVLAAVATGTAWIYEKFHK